MPSTCGNLLPNYNEYIGFMETTGDAWFYSNPKMSEKVYQLLAVRKIYEETARENENPVNELIKNTLCNCYDENDQKLFTADSSEIKTCLSKSVAGAIKEAQDYVVTVRIKNMLLQKSLEARNRNSSRIDALKLTAYNTVKKQIDTKTQSKTRSR
jgi:hypothetical protein